MRRLALIAFLIGNVLGAPAWASAYVQVDKGSVSVNAGQGFREVVGTTEVLAGYKVMAKPGNKGRIVYSSGCAVAVYPGVVVTVDEASCKKPMLLGEGRDPKELCDPSTDPKCLVPAAPGTPWYLLPVGIALAVGVACIGFCGDHDGGGNGRSP